MQGIRHYDDVVRESLGSYHYTSYTRKQKNLCNEKKNLRFDQLYAPNLLAFCEIVILLTLHCPLQGNIY